MVDHGAKANETVLPAVVSFFCNPEKLEKLVDCIDLNQSVRESFIHPSGFDKLVLLSGKHFKVRLHNFHPTDVQRPSENIHTHRWEFASSILRGFFIADFFQLDDKGTEERNHYQYHHLEGMTHKGQATLRKCSTRIHSTGTSYFLSTSELHSIVDVSPKGAVSLIATGFARGETTEVFSSGELDTSSESASCGLGMFTGKQIKQKLAEILNSL